LSRYWALSYRAVAEHVTGQKRFRDAFLHLARDQAYLANLVSVKLQFGPGTGNQERANLTCLFP
jgi:hypothetical protein